ncbi:MAG: ROK family protein [Pirellulaceae bacterium]
MAKALAGIDLGGTTIKAALAGTDGMPLVERSIPTQSHLGAADVLERIGQLIETMSSESNREVAAIGVGVPGLVDIATGITRFLPNFPGQWRDVAVAESLRARLKAPVRLLNDARTATLAELKFGHGVEQPNITLAFFTLGTGVGGGVAINGHLRLGPLGAAGELGHQTIRADGPRCGCGNRGCLETLASGPAIAAEGVRLMRMGLAPALHNLVAGNADLVTTREMAVAAETDAAIREAILSAANYIGIAAANVVTILHPDLIVLGGGVAELGDILTDTVTSVIQTRVGMFPADNVRVARSRLGERAGVLGAVALAAEAASS